VISMHVLQLTTANHSASWLTSEKTATHRVNAQYAHAGHPAIHQLTCDASMHHPVHEAPLESLHTSCNCDRSCLENYRKVQSSARSTANNEWRVPRGDNECKHSVIHRMYVDIENGVCDRDTDGVLKRARHGAGALGTGFIYRKRLQIIAKTGFLFC
jgi:hypothetical protein